MVLIFQKYLKGTFFRKRKIIDKYLFLSNFCLALLLFAGILNPTSRIGDIAISFFIFGLVSKIVLKNKNLLVTFLFLFIAWTAFAITKTFYPIIVVSSLSGFLVSFYILRFKLQEKIPIFILVFLLLLSALFNGKDLRVFLTRNLPLYTYNNDPSVFLKTFFLMKEGTNYYDAFKISISSRFSIQTYPGDVWGWRTPTLFSIWSLLPGKTGLSLYVLFLALSSSVVFVSYRLLRKYLPSHFAILSPYLIFPYIHYAVRDQMFLETEWWGLYMFIFGLFFLIKRKFFFAAAFFSMSVLFRELYMLPITFMVIYSIFKQRKLTFTFLIPIISFILIYVYHLFRLREYINIWETLLVPKTVSDPSSLIHQTLAFASWEYLFAKLRPFLFLLPVAFFGCVILLKKVKEAVYLILSFALFPIFFLKFGITLYHDYWGILYIPIAIILSPLILLYQKKVLTKY